MNYIIVGTSRSGKTMLTNKICKELNGFSKISIDNMIGAFEHNIPQLNINFKNGQGNKSLLPEFVDDFLIGAMDKDNDIGLYYVLEGDGLPFSKLLDLNKHENIKLIILGKSSISVQEYVDEIRYYEGKYLYSEWTRILSDSELIQLCENWINRSKDYQNLCKEYNIPFYDTSYQQKVVIDEIFEKIKDIELRN